MAELARKSLEEKNYSKYEIQGPATLESYQETELAGLERQTQTFGLEQNTCRIEGRRLIGERAVERKRKSFLPQMPSVSFFTLLWVSVQLDDKSSDTALTPTST